MINKKGKKVSPILISFPSCKVEEVLEVVEGGGGGGEAGGGGGGGGGGPIFVSRVQSGSQSPHF